MVVSYDITDDRRRSRVARVLEDHGTRVQYSVFDCLLNEKALLALKGALDRLIDHETDSVRFYRLCASCRGGIELLGRGTVLTGEDIIIL